MSISLTRFSQKLAHSMSWIAATSISNASTSSRCARPSLSFATKENILLQRRYSHPVDKNTGIRSDQTVILTTIESAKVYPDALRRVSFLRCRNRQATEVSHQQLRAAGTYDRTDLQVPLAGGIVFQMDQAALTHQVILRHEPERREDSDLDRRFDLMCSSPSFASVWDWRRVFTKFYRFSA